MWQSGTAHLNNGDLGERFNPEVLKTSGPQGPVSSNLTVSAKPVQYGRSSLDISWVDIGKREKPTRHGVPTQKEGFVIRRRVTNNDIDVGRAASF
jgi:hypothetical protein